MKLGIVTILMIFSGLVVSSKIPAQSYMKGDFHQHTTYTDGSFTIGYMMSQNNKFGLDWWANSEHGGGSERNGRVSGSQTGTTVTEYWDDYKPNPIIGTSVIRDGHQVMWRWQVLRDSSFSEVLKARSLYPSKTILQSLEFNIPGHEHGSLGIINNQFDVHPNCNPLAEFEFKFDNSDEDLVGGVAQGWTKSTLSGHAKALEALTWLKTHYPTSSYLVIAHPERYPQTTRGYSIAAIREMNSTAPDVCFGFEGIPGHHRETTRPRGLYETTSVGGGTYGGSGIYVAKIGGLWDALLSEGRRFWLFSNSDCHSEVGDFYPGQYQKNYTYTRGKLAQNIVDGLRSGNTWVVTGDLIDSLIYTVEPVGAKKIQVSMGSCLNIAGGKAVKITIKARDPQTNNFNSYSNFKNPVLDHIDIIQGKITGMLTPSSPDYKKDTVNTTSVIARFDASGNISDANGLESEKWKSLGNGWIEMSLIIPNVTNSTYFRLRGTNHGLNVPNETDASGNPLPDILMNPNNAAKAFADLWFYSNPIFVYTSSN